jgi:DNA polymerase-3 subunit delta'
MNWGMAGHDWAVSLLKEHILRDQLRHAYLFTGPDGVGRRTLALRFAQALNCPEPLEPGEACQTCPTCSKIEDMLHTDLTIVEPEGPGEMLKVDQVRGLTRSLALSPYESQYRIALLLRFEEAHPSAANALLKTLEEPSRHVILILTADSVENLLPTVVSRCEVMRLRPVALKALSQWLAGEKNITQQDAQLYAHISGGRPGDAIRLHDEPGLLKQRDRYLDDLYQLLSSSRTGRFKYVSSLISPMDLQKTRAQIRERLFVWITLWRDVLFCAYDAQIPYVNQDQLARIRDLAGAFGYKRAQDTLSALQRTQYLLGRNVNPRLAAEWMMLRLPHGEISTSVDDQVGD